MTQGTVDDWMIGNVATISRTRSVYEAAVMMREKRVGSLIVVDTQSLTPEGIFSKTNLLKMVITGKDLNTVTIQDAMTDELVVVDRDTAIHTAIGTLVTHGIKRLPVVDTKHHIVPKLVGILTATTIIKRLSRMNDIELIKKIITGED